MYSNDYTVQKKKKKNYIILMKVDIYQRNQPKSKRIKLHSNSILTRFLYLYKNYLKQNYIEEGKRIHKKVYIFKVLSIKRLIFLILSQRFFFKLRKKIFLFRKKM